MAEQVIRFCVASSFTGGINARIHIFFVRNNCPGLLNQMDANLSCVFVDTVVLYIKPFNMLTEM